MLVFSVTALWAQQKATPKAGEGISSFLLRHNRSPKKYYDDFVELNRKKLGKNKVLKMGVSYIIPPVKKSAPSSMSGKSASGNDISSNSRSSNVAPQSAGAAKIGTVINEPLFGKALANVKVTSDSLQVRASMLSVAMEVLIRELSEELEGMNSMKTSTRMISHSAWHGI